MTDDCQIIRSDNLQAMRGLPDAEFALVYCDPPFLTGREHRTRAGCVAFSDRWAGLPDYLAALRARVTEARRLLLSDGCLVVHVDPRTSHYVKVMLDEVFGPGCFASEIIWRYRRWPAKTRNFQRVHDVLLRYVRDVDAEPRWAQLYEPLAASTRATWGDRKQRAVVGKDRRRTRSESTSEPSQGVPLGDVWEIGIIAPVAKERTGYPTQKPEALLERLIRAVTYPGDAVLDPYCGSGTTLAVCQRLGRRSVGIDESAEAVRVARGRLSPVR